MIGRALLVWVGIAALATANGILRETALVPALGAPSAQWLSVALLACIILAVSIASIRWISRVPARDAWAIGAAWTVLAIAFDLLLGGLEQGRGLGASLRALTPGQAVVFIVTFVAPAAAAAFQRKQL